MRSTLAIKPLVAADGAGDTNDRGGADGSLGKRQPVHVVQWLIKHGSAREFNLCDCVDD